MAPTKKIRKPVPPANFRAYCVPKDRKNFPCGILNVPAAHWTCASKVVSDIDSKIVQTKSFEDIYSLIVDAFSKLSTSSEIKSIKLFAKRCKDYASNLDYKQECKNSYELKKIQLADLDIERKILNLARKGMHTVAALFKGDQNFWNIHP
ncbi:hypothetical protein G6F46_010856 [Rhizopus delemar]|uniref:Uncharacterized protein n=2 Tax=Rhizopus TaxID=4842 RepID=A0A9P6YUE6_9FUNG|nr:hypothetical protein G6F55_010143 [Rhizopus delemar]KAG1536523.1 hypothetical protein G6F51_010923 [Rhizopus arrhizus]KAG1490990.1 hypothetical protein G6F54_010336 [Rhizopus delemar]KAG1503805.1 hypothetical protein G6F53_010544 [Rhizopus delemar]KAG1518986.1 hypothetical protein G6F52_008926 [Rhizopus delemar]